MLYDRVPSRHNRLDDIPAVVAVTFEAHVGAPEVLILIFGIGAHTRPRSRHIDRSIVIINRAVQRIELDIGNVRWRAKKPSTPRIIVTRSTGVPLRA